MTDPVLAPEGNYDKRICHAAGGLIFELAETEHGHAPDFTPEDWTYALRATAQTLLAYDPDSSATIKPAQDALRWIADNLSMLWD